MKNTYEVIKQSALFFLLISFLVRRGHFFHLNHVRKVRKRCSHSKLSFQAIILGLFDRNVGLCCSRFSVVMGEHGYFH